MSTWDIKPCADSLLNPRECCVCREPATMAVLTKDFVEHTRCLRHCVGGVVGTKPLVIDPLWDPEVTR